MVENTTAFENSGSLSLGGDSLLLEDDPLNNNDNNSNHNDYEVVSHNGSDIRSAPDIHSASRNSYFGSGILILDGVEDDGVIENGSVLSVPGTDSLPTDVGTVNNEGENPQRRRKVLYGGWLMGTLLFCGLTCAAYTWRSSMLEWQEKFAQQQATLEAMVQEQATKDATAQATIQRLEQVVQEREMALEFFDESEYVTLLDNCWVKAKAKWCDQAGGSFPQFLGGAIGEASKLVTETVTSLTGSMKKDIPKMTGALSLIVEAAGDAVAAEFQEFSENPMDYMAEAVKGTQAEQRITAKGIDEVLRVMTGKTFYMTDEEAAEAKKKVVGEV